MDNLPPPLNLDPRWKELRAERLAGKWAKAHTRCPYCMVEMWFTDFETIPEFRERSGHRDADLEGRIATLDHIVPRVKFGPRFAGPNITVMCMACNQEKGAHDPLIWIELKPLVSARRKRRFIKRANAINKFIAAKRRECHG